jgi:hypothetical protein
MDRGLLGRDASGAHRSSAARSLAAARLAGRPHHVHACARLAGRPLHVHACACSQTDGARAAKLGRRQPADAAAAANRRPTALALARCGTRACRRAPDPHACSRACRPSAPAQRLGGTDAGRASLAACCRRRRRCCCSAKRAAAARHPAALDTQHLQRDGAAMAISARWWPG